MAGSERTEVSCWADVREAAPTEVELSGRSEGDGGEHHPGRKPGGGLDGAGVWVGNTGLQVSAEDFIWAATFGEISGTLSWGILRGSV